jgi:hypothetical protein
VIITKEHEDGTWEHYDLAAMNKKTRELEHRLNEVVSILKAFTGLRDAFIQGIAAIEDAQDYPYDRSALAKRREKVRQP